MFEDNAAVLGVERVPVLPPDDGAAWRALYEGPVPAPEPVEDDVEGGEDPRSARAAEILDHAPRAVAWAD